MADILFGIFLGFFLALSLVLGLVFIADRPAQEHSKAWIDEAIERAFIACSKGETRL